MNANVLRRWVVEAERGEAGIVAPVRASPSPAPPKESFVAVPLTAKAECAPIRVQVRRGNLTVTVQWPPSAMHECAIWLHEVLK